MIEDDLDDVFLLALSRTKLLRREQGTYCLVLDVEKSLFFFIFLEDTAALTEASMGTGRQYTECSLR
jgi:hypothetical protein